MIFFEILIISCGNYVPDRFHFDDEKIKKCPICEISQHVDNINDRELDAILDFLLIVGLYEDYHSFRSETQNDHSEKH
jgi:hypothetical protein